MGRRRTTIEDVLARVDTEGPLPSSPSRPLTTPCWLWTGGTYPAGYGRVSVGDVSRSVHSFVYESLVGALPPRDSLMWLDHICRVRLCCRPDHLELTTALENQLRRADVGGAICTHGHAMTDENTYTPPGTAQRQCRQCRREANRRSKSRRRHARC